MSRLAEGPRYRAIERALRARIATLRPGMRLPSDTDLCSEFRVSRMTARHAMSRLAEEGLVRRDPGRGTFVAEPPFRRRANSLMTFSREMRRQGRVPSSRIVERVVRAAREPERDELRLGPTDEVVALARVRLADAEPVAFEVAVLPPAAIAAVLEADLERGSLHEALIGAGLVPARGRSTVVAEPASGTDARLLGVPPGAPLLVERRLILDEQGRPLERTESRYVAERYGLDVDFGVAADPRPPGRGRRARGRRARKPAHA